MELGQPSAPLLTELLLHGWHAGCGQHKASLQQVTTIPCIQAYDRSESTVARYDVNVHVAIGSMPFESSKLVTIAPAVVLSNASNVTMHVCQYHSNMLLTLEPGQTQPLVWFNPEAKPELMLQPISELIQWNWSGRFAVSEPSSHSLRVHAKTDRSQFAIIPVTIVMQVGSGDVRCLHELLQAE
jgi:hypothetical protein